MKPFIPSYIPSIGDIDAFLKVPRPDNLPEELGLEVLDEPTITGKDPYVFALELSRSSNKPSSAQVNIKTLEDAEKNPRQIQDWIDSIGNLHKDRLSASVAYSKPMPDIESLMQEWPEKIESLLKEVSLPDEKIDMPIDKYAKLVCNMLDIPVQNLNNGKGIIEALHVLFTLYSGVKDNQIFKNNQQQSNNPQSMKFS
jgi:intraflagellar transport protein 46